MRTPKMTALRIFLIATGTLAVAFMVFAMASSLMRHEVTETSSEVAPIEKRIPALAGHIESTEWTVWHISDPMPLVPGPTDYHIWGHAVIDSELSDELLRRYEWNDTRLSVTDAQKLGDDGDSSKKWLTSLSLNDTIASPYIGNLYFDGENTISFSIYTM